MILQFPPREEHLLALGRNGFFYATGLSVHPVLDQVWLENTHQGLRRPPPRHLTSR